MLNHFTFNGRSTAQLGLMVSGLNIYGAPSRVVEKVNIPYRSGDLIIDTGAYTNYLVSYEVSMMDNVKANAEALNEWLLSARGYCRLEDTYNPEYYRMGAYYNQMDYNLSAFYRYGRATISFDCKPQKYLLSGETASTFTASGTIENPSQMPSKPLIYVEGTGKLGINDNEITITTNAAGTYIDCDTMQVYKGSTNLGENVTLTDFPELVGGSNTVTLDGLSKVVITPRWWKL